MIQTQENMLSFVLTIVTLVIAITIHEFSHAFAADRLGDPTPRLQKRLTLNPLAHLDPLGTLFLIFFGFGWGKPVQYDPYNFTHARRDAAIVALAGPASNIITALLFSIVYRFVSPIIAPYIIPVITLNILLAIFNMLPIYPLDGFRVVAGLLSEQKAKEWLALERFGIIFLLVLIFPFGSSSMLQFIMHPILNIIYSLLIPLTGMGFI